MSYPAPFVIPVIGTMDQLEIAQQLFEANEKRKTATHDAEMRRAQDLHQDKREQLATAILAQESLAEQELHMRREIFEQNKVSNIDARKHQMEMAEQLHDVRIGNEEESHRIRMEGEQATTETKLDLLVKHRDALEMRLKIEHDMEVGQKMYALAAVERRKVEDHEMRMRRSRELHELEMELRRRAFEASERRKEEIHGAKISQERARLPPILLRED